MSHWDGGNSSGQPNPLTHHSKCLVAWRTGFIGALERSEIYKLAPAEQPAQINALPTSKSAWESNFSRFTHSDSAMSYAKRLGLTPTDMACVLPSRISARLITRPMLGRDRELSL